MVGCAIAVSLRPALTPNLPRPNPVLPTTPIQKGRCAMLNHDHNDDHSFHAHA
jgi:hypothetical protein